MADNQGRRAHHQQEPDVFRDLGGSPAPPGYSEAEEAAEDYSAHNLAQEEVSIAFYHADGMITVEFYRNLQTVVCPPPYRMISLMYFNGVYVLEGHNLHQLIPRIRRHRLGEVYCYDPGRHGLPEDQPVVESIIRLSPEELSDASAPGNDAD
ncbi:MAG: hypothetical protein CL610_18845 [Anaerolineaceae bacterium]|nr:hypothetical protein [Anaerolineaceae bacterium]